MEEPLFLIDIVQDGETIVARVKSEFSRKKFSGNSLEGVLEQLFFELPDEV